MLDPNVATLAKMTFKQSRERRYVGPNFAMLPSFKNMPVHIFGTKTQKP